ncbi:MAG: AEC family transporter [Marinobacterium sp.]|nr:AEC family transporter [Marinobacterium sp.]
MEIITALLPVILAIMAGFCLRRYAGVPLASWQQMSFVLYYLFMPALEIKVLANKPLNQFPLLTLITAVTAVLLLMSLWVVMWQRWVRPQPAATFTSLYQGAIRFNTFVSLVVADQLAGDTGIAATALLAALIILLVNLFCVLVFVVYLSSQGASVQLFLKETLTNPLILGALTGLGLNLSGLGLSGPLYAFVDLMGAAALPVGLLVVGAALQTDRLRGNWEVIWTASVFQLLLKPALAVSVAVWLDLTGVYLAALLLCFTVPAPPSAYVLALQKGGDSDTMAAIITAQTMLSALTMPIIFSLVL